MKCNAYMRNPTSSMMIVTLGLGHGLNKLTFVALN